jgi:uncharacterized protein (TIGR00369 family)
MKTANLEQLEKFLSGTLGDAASRFHYPPAIAKTIGCRLIAVGEATATIELEADPEKHGNPMGTLHGGVLCDIADLAIGTAHSTTLLEGESFTSLDLQINFFRPIWNEKITAKAVAVNRAKTVSRYVCDILKADGKLVAQVTSSVMTLRQDKAQGR